MTSPGPTLRNIPAAKSISTVLALTDHGTVGSIANAGAALVNLFNVDAVLWHEGLLRIEVLTVGGKGATPTAVGASSTFSLFYAFTDTLLDATADAPTILATIEDSLVCALPDAISARATGTFTLSGLPNDGDSVYIGSDPQIVYRFKNVIARPYDVKIAGTAAATATNLINAINFSGGTVGTDYYAGAAAHPSVTAVTGGAGIVTVKSISYGTAGNGLATTDDTTNGAWGAASLSGGSAAGSAIHATDPFVHAGKYLYVWYDRTAFAANALIDVTAKLIRL